MKAAIARLAKKSLRASGFYGRRLRADRFPGVLVLCYHGIRKGSDQSMAFAGLHVTAAEFEGHCRVLRNHCHPIALEQWRSALAGKGTLPPRPVLVTFDDGYRTMVTDGLPILEKYAIPATVFACSVPVSERTMFWFDALALRADERFVDEMKGTASFEEWRRRSRELSRPVADNDPHAPITVGDLQLLASNPLIEIGGHTASHPILSRVPTSEQRDEIVSNREQIEAWTGRPVRAFAYPNGGAADYLPETVTILRDLGFDSGFTLRYSFAGYDEPPLERSRFLMLAGVSEAELLHRIWRTWPRRGQSFDAVESNG